MLNPALDIGALRREFARAGRIQIRDVLDPGIAARLHTCLEREVPWTLAYIDGDEPRRLTHDELRTLTPERAAAVQRAIQSRARDKFQFMYNSYMMLEAYAERRDPHLALHGLFEYMNSRPWLDFIKSVTGVTDIVKADAQATRYIAGHFLKRHDDTLAKEGRRLAYVLSLTRDWQADWGGLLQFLDRDGNVIDTFMPRYNALNLFAVPVDHCVSYVAAHAQGARYSITGWLRA